MDTQAIEQKIEEEFHVSQYIILYKFISGILELGLGIGIILFGKSVMRFYRIYKTRELMGDPHDLVINLIEKLLPFLFSHRNYIILMLIVIGLVKIIGALGLFYKKHWGIDLLIGMIIAFLPFDTYSMVTHPSPLKFIYLLLNIFIFLYLVNFKPKEYVRKIRHRVKRS